MKILYANLPTTESECFFSLPFSEILPVLVPTTIYHLPWIYNVSHRKGGSRCFIHHFGEGAKHGLSFKNKHNNNLQITSFFFCFFICYINVLLFAMSQFLISNRILLSKRMIPHGNENRISISLNE